MNKLIKISCLVLIALFMLPDDADAQRRRKKKKKKKKAKTEQQSDYRFQDQLWYGAGGALGFGQNSYGSEFNIGITPMVGYKVTPWLSAGPRFVLNFSTGRYNQFGTVLKLRTFDYGAGVFARAKSNFGIFGHLEYLIRNDEFGTTAPVDSKNNIPTERETVDAAYIGIGYSSQNGFSKWAYEIQLNYDLLAPEDTTDLPIDLRFALTYNF